MKKYFLSSLLSILFFTTLIGQDLKPYILAGKTNQSMTEVLQKVKTNMSKSGLTVVGEYNPESSKDKVILAFTSDELKNSVNKIGGFKAFALALRVALTTENGQIYISYTNPEYWGRAYYMDKWSSVSNNYNLLAKKLKTALSGFDENSFIEFGSKKGVSVSDLKKYHYGRYAIF
ncbi:MAG: hypothetical protein R2771_11605 [Saprospiraceae bacterium]